MSIRKKKWYHCRSFLHLIWITGTREVVLFSKMEQSLILLQMILNNWLLLKQQASTSQFTISWPIFQKQRLMILLFWSIQLLYYDISPTNEQQLITIVQQAQNAHPVEKLNKMLLTYQTCMNEILKDNGGNSYGIFHMNKGSLMKKDKFPLKILMCKKATKFN